MRTALNRRRPGLPGLFSCLLAIAAALSPAGAQEVATTTVSDVIYRADGTPAAGTLVISWPAFTTAEGKAVAAGNMGLAIGEGGAVTVALAPNEGATPAGTFYRVTLRLNDGTTHTENWLVPAASPVTIAEIRSTVLPAAVAASFVRLFGDEIIQGTKTFALSPLVPEPELPAAAASKAYVDSVAGGGGGTLGPVITLPPDGSSQTIYGALQVFGQVPTDPTLLVLGALDQSADMVRVIDSGGATHFRVQADGGVAARSLNQTRYADQYPTLQAAINDAATAKTEVFIPKRDTPYCISATLTIPSLPLKIRSNGAVIQNCANTLVNDAMLKADFSAGAQQAGLVIEGLVLVGNNDDAEATNTFKRGIRVQNASNVRLSNIEIRGVETTNGGASDALAVLVSDGSEKVTVENVTVAFSPSLVTDLPHKVGFVFTSPVVDAHNGVFTGASPLPQTTQNIQILNSQATGGTQGISLQNVKDVLIQGGRYAGQGHRNIHLFITNANVRIVGVALEDSGSTNLSIHGNSRNVTVAGNYLSGTSGGMGNNIAVWAGARNITITGNTLKDAFLDAIYIANAAEDVEVTGNVLVGWAAGSATYAGLRIEGTQGPNVNAIAIPDGVRRVTFRGNHIYQSLTGSRWGVFVLGKRSDSIQPNADVSGIDISGNSFHGGQYAVLLQKNATTATYDVTVGRNEYSGQSGAVPIFSETGFNLRAEFFGVAPPAIGNWSAGARVWVLTPIEGGHQGWVNVAAGAPGTWQRFGIGTATSTIGLFVAPPFGSMTSANQIGAWVRGRFDSTATTSGTALVLQSETQAASYTAGTIRGLTILNATKGSGSTITNLTGLHIDDQTQGTNNWAIRTSGNAKSQFDGGIQLGTAGAHIKQHLSATAALDFPSIAANSCSDLTMTVSGAAAGDPVALGLPHALASTAGLSLTAWVSAADTVTVRACNSAVTNSADPASATVRVSVWKY